MSLFPYPIATLCLVVLDLLLHLNFNRDLNPGFLTGGLKVKLILRQVRHYHLFIEKGKKT